MNSMSGPGLARVRKVALGMDCTRGTADVVAGLLVDAVDVLEVTSRTTIVVVDIQATL